MSRPILHSLVCVLCCWALTLPGNAQKANRGAQLRRLDLIASYYARQGTFMGTILVARGDKILLNKGYGYADLEWKIPQQSDAVFHLASVSKQFTAAAALMLQEDGKLQVTAPISRYLPNVSKAWAAITVGGLLSHTSGLQEMLDDPRLATWSMTPQTVPE